MVNTERNGTRQHARRRSRRLAQEEKIVSKVERMLVQSGVRPILKMREHLHSDRTAFEQAHSIASLLEVSRPSTLNLVLGWHQDKLMADLERSLGAFRRFLLSLPEPIPLSPLELQAREAWERFDGGDPEPLDSFVKIRLGIMAYHDGPLPDDLRERVFQFLDCCFAPSPLYPPGDWFLLGEAGTAQLVTLIDGGIKMFPDLVAALSDERDKTYKVRLAEELPGAARVAWDDIQIVSGSTLLNATSKSLRKTKSRGHYPLPDDVQDQSLAHFEAIEAVNQLDTFEQRAAFSPQQAMVWQLLRKGMKIAEIANTLGIPPKQVSVQKHNAIQEVRRVASR